VNGSKYLDEGEYPTFDQQYYEDNLSDIQEILFAEFGMFWGAT